MLSRGPGGVSDMARGFGYSIYLMLGLVFGIIGIIVLVIVRTMIREERQRAERERQKKDPPPPPS